MPSQSEVYLHSVKVATMTSESDVYLHFVKRDTTRSDTYTVTAQICRFQLEKLVRSNSTCQRQGLN